MLQVMHRAFYGAMLGSKAEQLYGAVSFLAWQCTGSPGRLHNEWQRNCPGRQNSMQSKAQQRTSMLEGRPVWMTALTRKPLKIVKGPEGLSRVTVAADDCVHIFGSQGTSIKAS